MLSGNAWHGALDLAARQIRKSANGKTVTEQVTGRAAPWEDPKQVRSQRPLTSQHSLPGRRPPSHMEHLLWARRGFAAEAGPLSMPPSWLRNVLESISPSSPSSHTHIHTHIHSLLHTLTLTLSPIYSNLAFKESFPSSWRLVKFYRAEVPEKKEGSG